MGEIVDITRGIYRRVYSGFITGRRICSVSVEAEAWFWRIQAVADDFGNLPGDALLVWQSTVGRRGVTMQSVSKWIDELVSAGLLLRYSENGESYLHITYWSEESWPASKNGRRAQRYPRPAESGGIRVNPGESGNIQVSPGESGCYQYQYQNQDQNQTKTPAATRKPRRAVGGDVVSPRFIEFWQAFPSGIPNRKQDRKKCSEVWAAKKLDDQADRILADVKAKRTGEKWTKDKGAFIEAPLVYLNNERWMDQDAPGSTFDWKGRWQALPDQTRQEWTQAFRIETKDRQTRPGEFGEWVSARLERVGGAA